MRKRRGRPKLNSHAPGMAAEFHARPKWLECHASRFNSAGEVFADAPDILSSQRPDFSAGLLVTKTHRQITQRNPAMAGINEISESARRASESRHTGQWQSLE